MILTLKVNIFLIFLFSNDSVLNDTKRFQNLMAIIFKTDGNFTNFCDKVLTKF